MKTQPLTLDAALAQIADLEGRLGALADVAELQCLAIRHLKANLAWLERENPLPIVNRFAPGDPFGLLAAANAAAGRLPR